MLVFDVRCEVREPIELTDTQQGRVTIAPGVYRLQGVENLVHGAAGRPGANGTEITFVTQHDGRAAYTVSAAELAHFIAEEEVGINL